MTEPRSEPHSDPGHAETLHAYRREKRAQLHDEGPERLRLELARLEHWLAAHDRGEDPYGGRVLRVDVDFRRAKVQVLREVLGLDEAA